MESVESVHAIAGRGLEGDRYFLGSGTYSRKKSADREVTLIETEAIEAIERDHGLPFEPGESRRNVATRDVALNHLVGRSFRVGQTTLQGIRLCEPCSYLEKATGKGVIAGLKHRGGLRAQIIADGEIRVGDAIQEV